jgi:hypothetical protein
MTTSAMNQDEILSLLKALLIEKNYLSKKDADTGTWPTAAQAAWESYAYHVLGQSYHFMIPNSEQELVRLGIPVPEKVVEVKTPITATVTKAPVATRVSDLGLPKKSEPVVTEPKTLSRVINHDAV